MLGRDFVADDDRPGAQPVALIGHGVWQNRYGSNPSVIGRASRINDVPAGSSASCRKASSSRTTPISGMPLAQTPSSRRRNAISGRCRSFGQLAPGVTREQAQGEMLNITQRLEQENPDTNKDCRRRSRPSTKT